jgi:hypothetical protein
MPASDVCKSGEGSGALVQPWPKSGKSLSPNELHFVGKIRVRVAVRLGEPAAFCFVKAACRNINVLRFDPELLAAHRSRPCFDRSKQECTDSLPSPVRSDAHVP